MIRVFAVVLVLASVIALSGRAQTRSTGGLIRIFAITVSVQTVDVGSPGPSAGDQRIAGLVLYDRHNRIIGNGYRTCSSLDRVLNAQVSMCQFVFALPRGKLVAMGTRSRRDYYLMPVVGGTLLYSNVQGTLIASTITTGPPRRERLLFSLNT